MSIIDKIFGDPNEKVVKTLRPIVEEINKLEEKFKAMGDEELREQTVEFRKKLGVETDMVKSPQPPLLKGELSVFIY